VICHKYREANLDCVGSECSLWEHERQECSEKSYFGAWAQVYLINLRMIQTMERMEEFFEEDEPE